ncbi:UNVERIFIED_CONTAM: hypothetical protein RMT77_011368 [Armadillidium vulgare]
MSTYFTAPYALLEHGWKVDEVHFRNLFATAAVINVRDKVALNDLYEISVEDVQNWVQQNGIFPKHCIVIFDYGWDEGRYPDPKKYFGTDKPGDIFTFPRVSEAALKVILEYERSHGVYFVGFGTDAPALHNIFGLISSYIYGRNKYGVAGLKDLKRLPPKGAKIMVMPVKIKGAPGAPARVAARLPYY